MKIKTIDQLKTKLVKYGYLQICKEGTVFTVLITGKELAKQQVVTEINDFIMDYAKEKYPFIECMRNDDGFYCLVLKQKS